MLSSINISLTTFATWQALLVVLSIVSTTLSIYKMTKGSKQNEITILAVKDELKTEIFSIKDDIKKVTLEVRQTRQDVEDTTQRLEAHIDRTSVAEVERLSPKPRRRKVADE